MRRDVAKYLFIGSDRDRELFFRLAQQEGIIEFIDSKKRGILEIPQAIADLIKAKKVLRSVESVPQEDLEDYRQAEWVAKRIVQVHDSLEKLEEEQRLLRQEMARVEVFGDFSPEDIQYIVKEGHRVMQYFFTKSGVQRSAAERDEVIYVGSAFDLDYYVAFNKEKTSYPGLTELRVERPYGLLNTRYSEIKIEIEKFEAEIKSYANLKQYIEKALLYRLDYYHLRHAQELVELSLEGKLFAVEAWVPKHLEKKLEEISKDLSIFHEQIVVEEKDFVPTYLENKGLARVGEDLVHIYDTPSVSDRDPSLWVLGFFSLFFAMIIGDAGYGLLMFGAALFLRLKFSTARSSLKRFFRLALVVSVFTVLWGVLTSSFFGIEVPIDSPLRKISLTSWLIEKKTEYVIEHQGALYEEWVKTYPELATLKQPQEWLDSAVSEVHGVKTYELFDQFNDDMMLELSLLIGSIHIILSFLRLIDRHWTGVGWILFIVGSYLYFPSIVGAVSMIHFVFGIDAVQGASVGLHILLIGIGVAVALSIIQKKILGLLDIQHLIQIFADIMSYLRLYALALAGMMMAITFNAMGESLGVVFGSIVILAGHVVNIILSIMGGVIHGLRLNFLEWYHYCFEGGGRMLRPLRLISTDL